MGVIHPKISHFWTKCFPQDKDFPTAQSLEKLPPPSLPAKIPLVQETKFPEAEAFLLTDA